MTDRASDNWPHPNQNNIESIEMAAKNNTAKQKRCKVCLTKYTPFNTTQQACSPVCAIKLVRGKEAKKASKESYRARKNLRDNDKSFQIKKAQQVFNKWIRLRDEGNDCISCGKPPKKKNAGHYKSRGGFPELRFEPLNCHLQCEHCNTHLSGNLSNYRISLVNKIGLDKVEWIEGPHEAKKYTIDDLTEIQELYKLKIKELEKC